MKPVSNLMICTKFQIRIGPAGALLRAQANPLCEEARAEQWNAYRLDDNETISVIMFSSCPSYIFHTIIVLTSLART